MAEPFVATCAFPKSRLALGQPSITLVVISQECFSSTQRFLDNLYHHTRFPFKLVYVDAASPKYIQTYLDREARKKGFTLLRTNSFLSPNQARNLGLSYANTDYVVFIDNDIHVSPGWLENLWQCAQDTDATIVSPLTCVDGPLDAQIYMAGGEARIFTEIAHNRRYRHIYQERLLVNRSKTTIQQQLYRRACGFAELRCMLVRRDIFEQVGHLDEKLLSTQEDIDFCLSVTQAGGRIFCEPTAVVNHLPRLTAHWADLAYFMLRWSDVWAVESLMYFQQKWGLDMDTYLLERYRHLGYRRNQVLHSLFRRLGRKFKIAWLEKIIFKLEPWLSQMIINCHAKQLEKTRKQLAPTVRVTDKSQNSTTAMMQHQRSLLCRA